MSNLNFEILIFKIIDISLKFNYQTTLNSQGTPGSGGIPQIWDNLKNQIQGNLPDMGEWQTLFSLFKRERTMIMSYNYSWTLLDYSVKC